MELNALVATNLILLLLLLRVSVRRFGENALLGPIWPAMTMSCFLEDELSCLFVMSSYPVKLMSNV